MYFTSHICLWNVILSSHSYWNCFNLMESNISIYYLPTTLSCLFCCLFFLKNKYFLIFHFLESFNYSSPPSQQNLRFLTCEPLKELTLPTDSFPYVYHYIPSSHQVPRSSNYLFSPFSNIAFPFLLQEAGYSIYLSFLMLSFTEVVWEYPVMLNVCLSNLKK